MLSPLLLFRYHIVNVILFLAFFIILSWTNLCALLGGTVGVLEAPVANLEFTPLSVLCLLGMKVSLGVDDVVREL